MKIALVHLNFATESGDPRMAYLLAGNLIKAGHTVVIYTAKFDPNCFPELNKGLDVRVISAQIGESKNTGIFGKVFERMQRERLNGRAVRIIASVMDRDFDAIICENDQSYHLGVIYKEIKPDAKVIWVMNNAPFRHTKKANPLMDVLSIIAARLEKNKVRRYLPGIDKIVVHDEEQRGLAESLGRDAAVLPIPVNFEKFYREVSQPAGGPPILLGVGSLSRARAFEDIVSAGIVLRKEGIDCRVILVCKDFWGDRDYREQLVALTKQDSNGDWVDFRFEGVDEAELLAIQAKSFAFIFPNHIRIWGMAAFEAMAAGLPIILSNSTSVAEVLEDGKNALFVAPGNPQEIAKNIKLLLDDPQRYESVATEGQDFVRQNLNWDAYIKRFLL